MKNLLYLSWVMLSLASCTAPGKLVTAPKKPQAPPPSDRSPRFLENISISPVSGDTPDSLHKALLIDPASRYASFHHSADIEQCSLLQFKYGILMNQPVESVGNEKLILFLDDWYGIPYRYGGSTKSGIDCSAFAGMLMSSVYDISLPRTSRNQYDFCRRVNKQNLSEGDLVFFNTTGRLSHVGVYLGNNKFAHASTSSGVMISDLGDYYYSKRYAGAGRIR